MAQPGTQEHVQEHGLCLRCGMHLGSDRHTLPCGLPEPTTMPAPPPDLELDEETAVDDDEP